MIRKLIKLLITCAAIVVVLVIAFPGVRDYAESLLDINTTSTWQGTDEIDDDVMSFLQSVFPNKAFADGRYSDCITKRFEDYSVQFEYEPIHMTQDAWCYVLPEPKFEKSGDLYKVTWHCTKEEDKTNVVKLVKENGDWKIDNVGYIDVDGNVIMEIDYGRQPVFVYDLENYPDELKNELKKLYGKLPEGIPSWEEIKSNEKVNSVVDKVVDFVKDIKEGK